MISSSAPFSFPSSSPITTPTPISASSTPITAPPTLTTRPLTLTTGSLTTTNAPPIPITGPLSPTTHAPSPSVSTTPVQYYRMKLPDLAVSFCSDEGKVIFREALITGNMDCYFGLASQFRTQEEPAFCGLSTLVMVLNTLEVDPLKIWKGPWRWYHENMLDCCIPLEVIEKSGVTFDQFVCLAICNTLDVHAIRADEGTTLDEFRKQVELISKSITEVIVISYSRSTLGQTGDGHFSPIGGYHPARDLVLILDVARFKYPPHWVPLTSLYRAMQELDKTTGLSRGYMILKKSLALPTIMFRFSSYLSITGSHLNRVNVMAFESEWELFLATPSSLDKSEAGGGKSEVLEDVLTQAICQLVDIHNKLDQSFRLLDEQVDVSCTTDVTHRCAVLDLITSLQTLPLFSLVTSTLDNNTTSTAFDTVVLRQRAGSGDTGTHRPHGGCGDRPHLAGDTSSPGSIISSSSCHLARSHYLVALLLFWPYSAQPGTLGSVLQEYIVCQFALIESALLQNEITQLRQQMTSVLSFVKQCKKTNNNWCSCSSH